VNISESCSLPVSDSNLTMSQYYIPPRQQSHRRSATTPSTSTEGRQQSQTQEGLLLNNGTSITNSKYIFPSPSSSDDPLLISSPSQSDSSIFSTPADAELYHSTTTFSVVPPPLRSSRARDDRSDESYIDLTVSTDTRRSYSADDEGDEVWDWSGDPTPNEDSLSESDSSGVEVDSSVAGRRWDIVSRVSSGHASAFTRHFQVRPHALAPRARRLSDYVRSRNHSRATAVSISTTSSRPLHDDRSSSTPHPRVRIPLLSLIASLFAVDETTLHLLTHSTTHHGSVLFPGHNALPDPLLLSEPTAEDEDALKIRDEEHDMHGFHKLLVSSDISSDSWKSLKRGLAMVYSNTTPVPSMGIVNLWGFVNRVLVKGGGL